MWFRLATFLALVALALGVSLAATLGALFPGRFRAVAARRRLRLGALLAVIAVLVLELSGRIHAPLGGGPWRLPIGVVRSLVLCFVASALVLAVTRTLAHLVAFVHRGRALLARGPGGAPGVPARAAHDAAALTRREVLERGVAVASLGGSTVAALAGAIRGREAPQVTELTVVVPELPRALEGMTLVQLTDLHIGVYTGRAEVDHLVERVQALRADVVVLTGDIMDFSPRHIPEGMRALGRLRAPRGVFAALGNHDHVTGAGAVTQGLTAVGIRPLVNASVDLDAGLTLAGVDDVVARRRRGGGPSLRRALHGRLPEAPVVLLAHNPVLFRGAAGRVALQLSGHTHGGQINVAGLPGLLLPFVAGRYVRAGSVLYVSRGLGCTGPPVRLAAPPEIVRIALTARG